MKISFAIMDSQHGDFTHEWDPNNPESVKNAKEMFDDLKKRGFLMFFTDSDGFSSKVSKFDEALGKIDFRKEKVEIGAVPPRAGG